MESYKYIIIGGGAGSIAAVNEFNKHNVKKEDVLLISEEAVLYNRIYLVDYIFGEVTQSQIVYPKELFLKINVALQTRIVTVQPQKRIVIDSSGKKYKYHKLLIATGAKPVMFVKPLMNNIFVLRTLDDAEKIKSRIYSVKHVTIVGCGAIGLELLDKLNSKCQDKEVVVIEKGSTVLSSSLEPEFGKSIFYNIKNFLSKNCKIEFNSTISNIKEINNKLFVTLTNRKKFFTEMIILVSGIKPVFLSHNGSISTLDTAETTFNNEIDKYCKTMFERIYACGDAVRFKKFYYPNYLNAVNTGTIAAKNMLEEKTELKEYTHTNVLEIFQTVYVLKKYEDNYTKQQLTPKKVLSKYSFYKKYQNLLYYNLPQIQKLFLQK